MYLCLILSLWEILTLVDGASCGVGPQHMSFYCDVLRGSGALGGLSFGYHSTEVNIVIIV